MDIVIIGAGRVGVASALLARAYTMYRVAIIDADSGALKVAREALEQHDVHVDLHQADESLPSVLRSLQPRVVLCCTPFHVNVKIATLCAELQCHYIDFTEDISVTKAVTALNPQNCSFVLQTGLAPGLVNSVGLELVKRLKEQGATPHELKMRVGALPLVGSNPHAYSLTWSSSGLINEYYQPVERIVNGEVVLQEPLTSHEEFVVDGTQLEAFNTSGGLGAPSMYTDVPNVSYKTVRYPGHLHFLQQHLAPDLSTLTGTERIERGIQIAEKLFTFTRKDVVYMIVRAVGKKGGKYIEEVYFNRFYSLPEVTALELTTAGTGVAVAEILLGTKPKGVKFGGQIPYHELQQTCVGGTFLSDL